MFTSPRTMQSKMASASTRHHDFNSMDFDSSSDEEETIAVLQCVASMLDAQSKRKRKRKSPRWWVRPWIERRHQFGAFNSLLHYFNSLLLLAKSLSADNFEWN
eukprot:TRINITY_DN19827_c0_g1_i9.p2 TRINITY_DN19827_c0_g1~~TRINITY_DN19827_c0_g1_i9.p2  ORF type:complete len:103 (+),score=2.84 TRINITY_DN19827_c0_g1_i9:249-557(+)